MAMELPWPYFGASYGREEIEAVSALLEAVAATRRPLDRRSPEIEAFEGAFAAFVGTAHAVAVSSGGAALAIGTQLLEIGPGDEVPAPALTFKATVLPVLEAGGRPVPVEVDAATLNMDPADLAAKVGPRTKAIFTVDYAGLPCALEPIRAASRVRNAECGVRSAEENASAPIPHSALHTPHLQGAPAPILDDAAHAAGAVQDGRRVGGWADVTCFSFQSQKNMTTLGEGGMLTTNDAVLAARARELRNFAAEREIGANLRMTPAQAAVGLVQLRKLDAVNARRRAVAGALREQLVGVPGITLPPAVGSAEHVHHLFPILLAEGAGSERRSRVMRFLLERCRITTAVMYEPWYRLPIFRVAGYAESMCPRTEALINRLLDLPIHPDYTVEQIAYLADSVAIAVAECG